MAERPKSLVVAMRELSSACGTNLSSHPEWFREAWAKDGNNGFGVLAHLLNDSADELERMQKLNGKLYKTLYPD